MKTFNITLDGHPAAVKQGDTLLDAARAAGIDIPALCYDPRLPPLHGMFYLHRGSGRAARHGAGLRHQSRRRHEGAYQH